ncbi:MAG TPA: hypothetical protein VGB70_08120 [Allosphingosinicella sp.]|jgi:hypothetical protein
MTKTVIWGAAALGLAAAAAMPAAAQYSPVAAAIGNTIANMAAAEAENRCMSGQPLNDKEVGEARTGGEAAMRQYLQLAAKGAKADARAAFARKPKHQIWSAGGTQGSAASVDDPLARRAAAGEAVLAPLGLVRAGDGGSALGIWALNAKAGGQPLGYYETAFRREAGVWKLSRLTLVEGGAAPALATQYCHKLGDVEPYVAAMAERDAKRALKKSQKAAARAEAEAKQAGKSGS